MPTHVDGIVLASLLVLLGLPIRAGHPEDVDILVNK